MNVLIVSQHFFPENFRINDFALALVTAGHKVTVLTGIPNYPEGSFFSGYGMFRRTHEIWNGVEVVRSPIISRGQSGKLRLAWNYLSYALSASLIGAFRLGRNYDVIFVHETSPVTVGIPAILMKLLTGAPILFWVLDLWPEYAQDPGGIRSPLALNFISRLTAWIYSHCDLILVQSKAFVASVQRMGVELDRIRYFPSWSEDVHLNSNLSCPVALPEGFRIVFAGNIGECQDFPSILAAAEILQYRLDIHWIIVGEGRMSRWVRGRIKEKGLEQTVHLVGRFPLELMPSFYSKADVMLVSLKGGGIFSSTIPGKVQSYLAAGKPIIAMIDGEGAKVINDAGAGFVCPASCPEHLAKIIESVCSLSNEELINMGANGKKFYESEFDRSIAILRAEKMFSELVAIKS